MNMNKGQRITIIVFLYGIAGLFFLGAISHAYTPAIMPPKNYNPSLYAERLKKGFYPKPADWEMAKFIGDAKLYLGVVALATGVFIQLSGKK
jgi:hypothetical protein